jgi:hypothetical protein
MGMFTWCCKGKDCGEELIMDEKVRISGIRGIYDGYGVVSGDDGGEFDTQGEDFPCWHQRCYDKATDKEKLDETPSKYGDNQGFGQANPRNL